MTGEGAASAAPFHGRGAAALCSRSRMAAARPSPGMGATAILGSRRGNRPDAAGRTAAPRLRPDRLLALSVASPATGAEADQKFAVARFRRIQPQRLARRIMAGEHARRLDRRPSLPRASTSIGPRRSSRSGPPVAATIVDSMPRSVAPPSMISGMRPSRLASTCAARVGLIRPLALADGAASGLAVACSSACMAGCAGTRSAMVGRPAVTSEAIGASVPAAARPGSAARANARSASARACALNVADRLRRRQVRNMDDQRVEARPALGLVDARDGLGIGGIGGEAVDRLGRHRDRLAGQHQPRRFGDGGVVERQDAGASGGGMAAPLWHARCSDPRDAAQ